MRQSARNLSVLVLSPSKIFGGAVLLSEPGFAVAMLAAPGVLGGELGGDPPGGGGPAGG